MKRTGTRIVTGVAVGIALLALGVSWKNAHARGEAHAALAELAKARRAMETTLRDAEQRTRAAEAKGQADLSAAGTAAGKVPATSAAATTPPRKSDQQKRESLARLIERTRHDPAVQQAGLEAQRPLLAWSHAALFRVLGLDAAQQEKFVGNVFERMSNETDLFAAARSLGLSNHDPAVRTFGATMEERYRAAQRDLLGDAGFRELETYEARKYPRKMATGLAGMAVLAGEPLGREQIDQLTEIVVRNTRFLSASVPAAQAEVDWQTVDAQARGILSERQWTLFTQAEAPGEGRAGTRFGWQWNQVIFRTVHRDPAGDPILPAPR